MTDTLEAIFDCEPADFLKESSRASALMLRLTNTDASINAAPMLTVNEWENMMG